MRRRKKLSGLLLHSCFLLLYSGVRPILWVPGFMISMPVQRSYWLLYWQPDVIGLAVIGINFIYQSMKSEVVEEVLIMNGKDVRIGVSLLVSDMENMVRFYRDTLGFQTQWNGGPFADFETASGELSLFMYSRKEFVKAIGEDYVLPKGINQTFEIAFWLSNFAEVDLEYERLAKLGVQFPTGEPITYPFGIRNFYVADPEGNLLEIGSTSET